MSMILVLGSKPEPNVPTADCISALACANASGNSAASLGLPRPDFTVMSAILSSGLGSGEQSLKALQGLETQDLWYYARPAKRVSLWKRLSGRDASSLMTATVLKERLRAVDYRFGAFHEQENSWWRSLVVAMSGQDLKVAELIEKKQASTGIAAIALALSLQLWDEVCVAGFSFELTHAYGANPEIDQRGTLKSKHADTDMAVLMAMARQHPELCTSEPLVHDRCGLRLWADPRRS